MQVRKRNAAGPVFCLIKWLLPSIFWNRPSLTQFNNLKIFYPSLVNGKPDDGFDFVKAMIAGSPGINMQ